MLLLKLAFTTLLSYLFVRYLIKKAHSLGLYDVPNERSHHCSITPSGAGIGFVLALISTLFLFEYELIQSYLFIFFSILSVFVIGIIDDRHDIRAKWKFVVIFFASFILWWHGLSVDTLGTWYGNEINLYVWIALPFTMFTIAGCTNALNLIDGIDGLAGSVSIVILFFFAAVGFKYHSDIIVILSSFTIATLVGFLIFNWNPAKIFMGDSGSLTLGFIISVLSVLSLEYIHPLTILYLTALPILDTLIVMVRRIRRGKSPFKADKTHIHHILVAFFDGDVKRTVVFLMMLQIIFSGVGYALLDIMSKSEGRNVPLFGLVGFAILFVLFYMIFTGIQKRQIELDKKRSKN